MQPAHLDEVPILPSTTSAPQSPGAAAPRPLSQITSRWLPRLSRVVAYAIAAALVFPLGYHLATGSDGHLSLLTDDFYYYAVVAENVVTKGRPTFDGITTTNGFHPLFMLVLMGLTALTGGTGAGFFWALAALFFVAAIVTYELYTRLGRLLFPKAWLVYALSALSMLEVTRMLTWGMETTLAVPLHALLMLEVARTPRLTLRRAAWLGGLTALLALARLDTVLLSGMMIGLYLLFAREAVAEKAAKLAAFAAGGAALPLYCLWNKVVFGHWQPLSATAKQLKIGLAFNPRVLGTLAEKPSGLLAFTLLPLALALFALGRGRRMASPSHRLVLALVLAFPPIFFTVFAVRSDWLLFDWYFYPLPPALFAAALFVCDALVGAGPRLRRAALAALIPAYAAALLLALRTAHQRSAGWNEASYSLFSNARKLVSLVRDRPGVYAMGDRAGLTAYLLRKPVVQLEGLMADAAMVEHIRRRDPLDRVLAEYGVDYLIVSHAPALRQLDGCYQVRQPDVSQAGLRSPKMAGQFCAEPLLHLTSPLRIHDRPGEDCHLYVFDLRREPDASIAETRPAKAEVGAAHR